MVTDLPELMSYDHIPPGFEAVIKNNKLSGDDGGGFWNLWWNVTASDDPKEWDKEIQALNLYQTNLDSLNDDVRLVRAHIAEWCRADDLFPLSIDVLCEGIGDQTLTKSFKLGCEGRGLLASLGIHNRPIHWIKQREFLFRHYLDGLDAWEKQIAPHSIFQAKVSGFLGMKTTGKIGLVESLEELLVSDSSTTPAITELYKTTTRMAFGKEMSQCVDCSELHVEDKAFPSCCCGEKIMLDAILLASRCRTERELWNVWDRYTQEVLLGYMFAINGWLVEESDTILTDVISSRFMTREQSIQLIRSVNTKLGIKNPVKEWLAGCLLKTLKGNRSWQDRCQLIDYFPEASSWLSFIRYE